MKKLLLGIATLLVAHVAVAQCVPLFGWQFSPSGQNLLNVNFNNNTGFTNTSNYYATYSIKFGDGSQSGFGTYISHNYPAPGTYVAKVIMEVHDSLNNTLLCRDSSSQNITVNYTPCGSTFTSATNPSTPGLVTFTANTPGAGQVSTSPVYTWSFGDGTSGTGNPVNHVYTANGTYTVTLTIVNGNCTYQVSHSVTVTSNMPSCANHIASFQTSVFSNTVNVYNTSPNFAGQSIQTLWNFGDGTTGNQLNTSHVYAAAGTYVITLTTSWTDTFNTITYCTSTVTHTVNVTAAPNVIRGYVVKDSMNMPSTLDTFKVWLITYDQQTSMLTAIDSVTVANYNWAIYEFHNHPAGIYLTKAAKLNQTNGIVGLVPTYHDSSLYWNSATNISHNGGYTSPMNIYMRTGTVTGGPGFIGGNVNQGANKGTGTTGAAVPNLQIMLLDASNHLTRFTYTDANGDYSFSNLPLGTYKIYPEEINYLTTPFANVTLTASSPSATGYIFGVSGNEIKPKATNVSYLANDNFLLYPNPSNGVVYIRWSQTTTNAKVNVTDLAGQVVYHVSLSVNSDRSTVNLAALQPGIYFIKIETEKGISTQKLLLQR